MYINLGTETSVRLNDIIGIFSKDTTFCCENSNEFLKISDEEGFVFNLCGDKVKTVILTEVDKNSKIFLSSVSVNTLVKKICNMKD